MGNVIDMPGADVRAKALTWPERAKAAKVIDAASYNGAAELLLGIKALRKEVADTFGPHIANAVKAHRDLLAERAKADGPLTEAETTIKNALRVYDDEQRRIAAERERVAREEARRAEEQRVLEQAAALEAEGNAFGDAEMVAEANALIDAPIAPPPVAPVMKETPKVAGITYREVWKFRVIDASKVPDQYKVVNEQAIGGVVRALKGATSIPGVEVYPERVVAAGGRA